MVAASLQLPSTTRVRGKGGAAKKVPPAAGGAKAGAKRRKGAKDEEGEEDDKQAQGDQGGGDREEGGEDPITPAQWMSVASGLAQICYGLSSAVQNDLCSESDVLLSLSLSLSSEDNDDLLMLYESCPDDPSRSCILSIITSLPFLPSSARLRRKLLNNFALGRSLDAPGPSPPPPSSSSSSTLSNGGSDEGLISHALKSLSVHPSGGNKLTAMILTSMGLRACPPASSVPQPLPRQASKKGFKDASDQGKRDRLIAAQAAALKAQAEAAEASSAVSQAKGKKAIAAAKALAAKVTPYSSPPNQPLHSPWP